MTLIISSFPEFLKRSTKSSGFWMFHTLLYPKVAKEQRKYSLSSFNKFVSTANSAARTVLSTKIQR